MEDELAEILFICNSFVKLQSIVLKFEVRLTSAPSNYSKLRPSPKSLPFILAAFQDPVNIIA